MKITSQWHTFLTAPIRTRCLSEIRGETLSCFECKRVHIKPAEDLISCVGKENAGDFHQMS